MEFWANGDLSHCLGPNKGTNYLEKVIKTLIALIIIRIKDSSSKRNNTLQFKKALNVKEMIYLINISFCSIVYDFVSKIILIKNSKTLAKLSHKKIHKCYSIIKIICKYGIISWISSLFILFLDNYR